MANVEKGENDVFSPEVLKGVLEIESFDGSYQDNLFKAAEMIEQNPDVSHVLLDHGPEFARLYIDPSTRSLSGMERLWISLSSFKEVKSIEEFESLLEPYRKWALDVNDENIKLSVYDSISLALQRNSFLGERFDEMFKFRKLLSEKMGVGVSSFFEIVSGLNCSDNLQRNADFFCSQFDKAYSIDTDRLVEMVLNILFSDVDYSVFFSLLLRSRDTLKRITAFLEKKRDSSTGNKEVDEVNTSMGLSVDNRSHPLFYTLFLLSGSYDDSGKLSCEILKDDDCQLLVEFLEKKYGKGLVNLFVKDIELLISGGDGELEDPFDLGEGFLRDLVGRVAVKSDYAKDDKLHWILSYYASMNGFINFTPEHFDAFTSDFRDAVLNGSLDDFALPAYFTLDLFAGVLNTLFRKGEDVRSFSDKYWSAYFDSNKNGFGFSQFWTIFANENAKAHSPLLTCFGRFIVDNKGDVVEKLVRYAANEKDKLSANLALHFLAEASAKNQDVFDYVLENLFGAKNEGFADTSGVEDKLFVFLSHQPDLSYERQFEILEKLVLCRAFDAYLLIGKVNNGEDLKEVLRKEYPLFAVFDEEAVTAVLEKYAESNMLVLSVLDKRIEACELTDDEIFMSLKDAIDRHADNDESMKLSLDEIRSAAKEAQRLIDSQQEDNFDERILIKNGPYPFIFPIHRPVKNVAKYLYCLLMSGPGFGDEDDSVVRDYIISFLGSENSNIADNLRGYPSNMSELDINHRFQMMFDFWKHNLLIKSANFEELHFLSDVFKVDGFHNGLRALSLLSFEGGEGQLSNVLGAVRLRCPNNDKGLLTSACISYLESLQLGKADNEIRYLRDVFAFSLMRGETDILVEVMDKLDKTFSLEAYPEARDLIMLLMLYSHPAQSFEVSLRDRIAEFSMNNIISSSSLDAMLRLKYPEQYGDLVEDQETLMGELDYLRRTGNLIKGKLIDPFGVGGDNMRLSFQQGKKNAHYTKIGMQLDAIERMIQSEGININFEEFSGNVDRFFRGLFKAGIVPMYLFTQLAISLLEKIIELEVFVRNSLMAELDDSTPIINLLNNLRERFTIEWKAKVVRKLLLAVKRDDLKGESFANFVNFYFYNNECGEIFRSVIDNSDELLAYVVGVLKNGDSLNAGIAGRVLGDLAFKEGDKAMVAKVVCEMFKNEDDYKNTALKERLFLMLIYLPGDEDSMLSFIPRILLERDFVKKVIEGKHNRENNHYNELIKEFEVFKLFNPEDCNGFAIKNMDVSEYLPSSGSKFPDSEQDTVLDFPAQPEKADKRMFMVIEDECNLPDDFNETVARTDIEKRTDWPLLGKVKIDGVLSDKFDVCIEPLKDKNGSVGKMKVGSWKLKIILKDEFMGVHQKLEAVFHPPLKNVQILDVKMKRSLMILIQQIGVYAAHKHFVSQRRMDTKPMEVEVGKHNQGELGSDEGKVDPFNRTKLVPSGQEGGAERDVAVRSKGDIKTDLRPNDERRMRNQNINLKGVLDESLSLIRRLAEDTEREIDMSKIMLFFKEQQPGGQSRLRLLDDDEKELVRELMLEGSLSRGDGIYVMYSPYHFRNLGYRLSRPRGKGENRRSVYTVRQRGRSENAVAALMEFKDSELPEISDFPDSEVTVMHSVVDDDLKREIGDAKLLIEQVGDDGNIDKVSLFEGERGLRTIVRRGTTSARIVERLRKKPYAALIDGESGDDYLGEGFVDELSAKRAELERQLAEITEEMNVIRKKRVGEFLNDKIRLIKNEENGLKVKIGDLENDSLSVEKRVLAIVDELGKEDEKMVLWMDACVSLKNGSESGVERFRQEEIGYRKLMIEEIDEQVAKGMVKNGLIRDKDDDDILGNGDIVKRGSWFSPESRKKALRAEIEELKNVSLDELGKLQLGTIQKRINQLKEEKERLKVQREHSESVINVLTARLTEIEEQKKELFEQRDALNSGKKNMVNEMKDDKIAVLRAEKKTIEQRLLSVENMIKEMNAKTYLENVIGENRRSVLMATGWTKAKVTFVQGKTMNLADFLEGEEKISE